MKTSNIIDIRRLGLLLRRQLFSNGKTTLIAFAGVSGILLFITLLVAFFNPMALNNLQHLYFTAMFVGGYIVTSNMYAELYPVQRSYQYMTLPVSVTERLLSGWLISGILFTLVTLLMIAIIVLFSNLVMTIIASDAPVQTINLKGALITVKIYLITQTVFLLGAAYFRKGHFFRTILTLFLAGLAIQIFTGVIGYLFFGSFFNSGITADGEMFNYQVENIFLTHIPGFSKFFFNWLMGPFLLVTTWFCLKERQV